MAREMEKTYQPQTVDGPMYKKWESSGFFNPDNLPGKRKRAFSIAMPPTNVTGELHLGHAVGFTIQDILTRYHRMAGDKALWLPGTDHAGISTQVMVERLIAEEGLDKHKLGREQFLQRVWQWKKKYGSRISEQTRNLGASCDWSREHFTMDHDLTVAVQKTFIKLFKEGLIYRGNRIINWCPRCGTALSDLEVKHQETVGKLWYIRYPLFASTKYVTVATTRPETMLGDTAVAVNPRDARYKKFIGQTVLVPIVNREVKIIADRRVEQTFGTGVVKVTPAHDLIDYEIGQEHGLDTINVIGTDRKMTKEAGEFYGQSVQDTRYHLLRRLEDEGLLEKTESYTHNQARCDRCGTAIEPLISKQWFIKIKSLAQPAIEAVRTGKIEIVPKRFEKIYFHWMDNIKDWCISRQLWWGHQLPVWYRGDEVKASLTKPAGTGWEQDPDTLDTWFSSGLWTFSTLGWPGKTKDYKTYHPTSVMETGGDILFFWVARMIMMSLYCTGKVPFKTVYLHGLVLDKDGKKMSKSKGTGIDPIPMTQKYGTDAIRLSLILGAAAGQDMRLTEEKIAGYRNFINKLWNVSRFALTIVGKPGAKPELKTLADRWIVSRLQRLTSEVTNHLESFHFSEAGGALYEFLWHELADWYLEITKRERSASVLGYVLEQWLKLAHPFIPFVTEEIWQRWRGGTKKDMLMVQPWPTADKKLTNAAGEKEFELIKSFIANIRNFRAEHSIAPQQTIKIQYWGKRSATITSNATWIETLAHGTTLIAEVAPKPTGSLAGLDFFIDFREDDQKRRKMTEEISRYIQALEAKLSNKNFVERAPKAVVEAERQKLAEQRERLKKLL